MLFFHFFEIVEGDHQTGIGAAWSCWSGGIGDAPFRTGQHPNAPSANRRLRHAQPLGGRYDQGERNASAVGTLVERSTLFVALAKMDLATAAAAATGFGTVLNRINA